MKYLLIRDNSDEMRHSLIKISGLKTLKSGDKPGTQSFRAQRPCRSCSAQQLPLRVAIDSRGPAMNGRRRGVLTRTAFGQPLVVGSSGAPAGAPGHGHWRSQRPGVYGRPVAKRVSVGPIFTVSLLWTSNPATACCGSRVCVRGVEEREPPLSRAPARSRAARAAIAGHVRMVRCRASCSSPGSPSPVARDTPGIVPISALARGHDHPQGVTTSPAVRSTMDTLSEVFTRRVCPGRHFRSVDGP